MALSLPLPHLDRRRPRAHHERNAGTLGQADQRQDVTVTLEVQEQIAEIGSTLDEFLIIGLMAFFRSAHQAHQEVSS